MVAQKDVVTGDILLVVYTSNLTVDYGINWMGLYNFTQRKWVYDSVALPAYHTGPPQVYNNRIYTGMNGYFTCHDLYTGKEVWKKQVPNRFSPDGFVINPTENNLVALNEGNEVILMALDLDTGYDKWRQLLTGGDASYIQYLNGVVYFCCTGTAYAVDAATGQIYWRMKSPDQKYSDGAFWMPVCTVVPPRKAGEKGRIVLSSYLNGYCYEAIR